MTEAILVVGGGGFIGSRLVAAFAARGDRVRAIVRAAPPDPAPPGVEYMTEPHTAEQWVKALASCRSVVHAASRSTPGLSAGKASAEVRDNLAPLACLLEALQSRPLPLLYLSSAGSIYGGTKEPGADEGARCSPRSYHGAGKLAAEFFISAWAAQFGGGATVLRPSNVYGPGQAARSGFAVIPTAMDKILRGETLSVWGDGSARRDYLYVDDLVDLCMRAAAPSTPGRVQTFNAASGRSISLAELLSMIESVANQPLALRHEAARAVDAPNIAVDPTRALNELGWSATTSLEEGLRRTWQWFSSTRR